MSRLTAYVIIPVFTILFSLDDNWFTSNFSVIGSQIEKQEKFVLWGLVVGIYFFLCLRRISAAIAARNSPAPKGMWLVPLALVLLTFAITTPYLPRQFPLKSFLHVIFAFLAAVCLVLGMFLTVWNLYKKKPKQYRPFLTGLAGIIFFSLFLLWLCGIVSSALEVFFTISSAILVQHLYENTCTKAD